MQPLLPLFPGTQGHGYFAKDKEVLQDISSFMAGMRLDERNLVPVYYDDTHCLTCSNRIRCLQAAVGATMFKLAPPAKAAAAAAAPTAAAAHAEAQAAAEPAEAGPAKQTMVQSS